MKKFQKLPIVVFSALLLFSSHLLISCHSHRIADGEYNLYILTTNDVHGTWFDAPYVFQTEETNSEEGYVPKNSLLSMGSIINKVRDSVGSENVVLIDAGDCLQGDNAPFFFNYVDTNSIHLFSRLVNYLKYDAIVVGNHDIETGHPVYDRVKNELAEFSIPLLAANALRNDNNKPYFQPYTIIERGGLKVAILGYTNPNIKGWLSEELWSGMHFESLIPLVQNDVNRLIKREKPQVVIVAVHAGVGNGDGTILESQGLDLFHSLKGVDFLICSHDHKPFVIESDTISLINSGSHSRNVGYGELNLKIRKGKIAKKKIKAKLLSATANFTAVDSLFKKQFADDFNRVKEFTIQPVGELSIDIDTRDAYKGMSHYMNLIHTLGIESSGADISLAAPLTFNKQIKKGQLIYNDLFTLYPYENALYKIEMSGQEIKNYLENSYDNWITNEDKEHILKIHKREDSRYSQVGWSFINRSYNFDSAGGINYTVDVTKPMGERVNIISMANGDSFDMNKKYSVAMTSYRASGGGDLLKKTGIDVDNIEERILNRYPEYREVLYQYLKKYPNISPERIGNKSVIGEWKFVPEEVAQKGIDSDMKLLFN